MLVGLDMSVNSNRTLPTTPQRLTQNANIKKVAVTMPGYQAQFLEFDQVKLNSFLFCVSFLNFIERNDTNYLHHYQPLVIHFLVDASSADDSTAHQFHSRLTLIILALMFSLLKINHLIKFKHLFWCVILL